MKATPSSCHLSICCCSLNNLFIHWIQLAYSRQTLAFQSRKLGLIFVGDSLEVRQLHYSSYTAVPFSCLLYPNFSAKTS